MFKKYTIEREGQIDFFDNYGIDWKEDDEILADNTDGVYNGVLMEFKLNINDPNKTLFQAIKYLSQMRIKGESIPATILLVDLNAEKAYQYNTIDYKDDVHKVYHGAASQNNSGFQALEPIKIFEYSDVVESNNLKKLLKREKLITELYMPIDIDENCIVGWAERYYREIPTASKGDFIGDNSGQSVKIKGEIREPKHFKGLINPYTGETNEKFKYLMDCLNAKLNKKDLGAYYTHTTYADMAAQMVLKAVNTAINAGKKDYIILDRCAGTGNLEYSLINLKDSNGDSLISHSVVSTYEYYEYKVLNERIGDKVRDILPPTEKDVVYSNGNIKNADALSKDYIDNPILKKYIEDENCAIILFENPPYRDQSQKNNKNETKNEKHTDKSYIRKLMKKEAHGLNVNDILNLFVWSAWKYYMRQPTDSYIIFAPIKHWKRVGISNKKFIDGYIFNRKFFHASSEAISCMHLQNIDEDVEEIILHAYNLDKNENKEFTNDVTIKKSHKVMSELFDKRKIESDDYNAICCNRDGTEAFRDCKFKPYYNDNIIGYLRAESYGFDANSCCLTRNALYNGHGFYLRKDKYIYGLPLFAAKQFPNDEWFLKNMLDTTSDMGDAYTTDTEFLKSCMIYTCLSNQNKCLSFDGSDGRHYQNELCFDNTDKYNYPIAERDLRLYMLDDDEKELLGLWNRILKEARDTGKCNENWTYGVYQITKEINTFTVVQNGKTKTKVYDYPQLNGNLATLRSKLKDYYISHIKPKMFKYELIK